MAAITAAMVKELRERTQAGMLDCKKALAESDGDMEKAVAYLREKGLAAAAKKAGRVAAEGAVESYIHMGGKIGVLVEVNCETDFVANTETFKNLCHDIALQIAAANPLYINKEDVPAAALEAEKEPNPHPLPPLHPRKHRPKRPPKLPLLLWTPSSCGKLTRTC